MKQRVLVSWSSGKDSAWMLHVLRQRDDVEVVGLLTTINETFGRVAMHGVRREILQAQALAVGLPLWEVPLPWPCTNADYELRMHRWLMKAKQAGITAVAFGDLFLEDVRAYREQQLASTGIIPLFPLWGKPRTRQP
jgi:diphthamide synthase (EF-2-diphthine--ammonia ligase)